LRTTRFISRSETLLSIRNPAHRKRDQQLRERRACQNLRLVHSLGSATFHNFPDGALQALSGQNRTRIH
jgi:hypothetical protein